VSFTKSLPTWEAGTPAGMTSVDVGLDELPLDGAVALLLPDDGVVDGLDGLGVGLPVGCLDELGDGLGLTWCWR